MVISLYSKKLQIFEKWQFNTRNEKNNGESE